jgi:hypothetical protein
MPDTTFTHVPAMTAAVQVVECHAGALSEDEFLSEYVAMSRPVVIREAVAHWPARTKWRDKDYLKRRSGHHRVFAYPHEYLNVTASNQIGRREMSFADAVDFLHAPETEMGFVGTAMPIELLPDIGDFRFFSKPPEPSFFYHDIRYFLFRNAGTTWHYHPLDETLMCQLIGRKRVGLLHMLSPRPHTIRNLFVRETYYTDPTAFDGFDNAGYVWFEATVDEGDALYIPPLWWHGVVALGRDFGVTAPITWRSPLPVIADTIRKLAAGGMGLDGTMPPCGAQALREVARKLGLEEELLRAAKQGKLQVQKEAPPNLRTLWQDRAPAGTR